MLANGDIKNTNTYFLALISSNPREKTTIKIKDDGVQYD